MPQESQATAAPTATAAESAPANEQEERLLDVLKLLIDSGKARTTQDLIRYAQQANSAIAVERLQGLADEGIPLSLAFDALSVHLRILAHKRNSSLLKGCQGKSAALVLPLPPSAVELFAPVCDVRFLMPDEHHHLPGYFHQFEEKITHGGRACRAAVVGASVVVFEAFRKGGPFFVDASIADVVDPRVLPPSVQLVAHVRPHRNPDDVELVTGSRVVHVL
jgi:hypothetical protein